MTVATIVLVGMFGLLEIFGAVTPAAGAKDFVEQVVETADVAVPILSAAVVLLYVGCIVTGTDTIIHTFNNRPRSAARQYVL